MKKSFLAAHILLFASCFSVVMSLAGCRVQQTPPSSTASSETATAIGRIVLGYGDRSPVPNLPLWIGEESHGLPATYTNEKGEFTLTALPVGQVVNVVDDHLAFQFEVTSSGIIDVGTFEYPLIHP